MGRQIVNYLNDKQKGRLNKPTNVLFLLYVFLIIVAGVISDYVNSSMFKQFALFCIPASLLGFKYGELGTISSLVKYIDFFVIVLSVAFVLMMRNLVQLVGDGLASYSQTMSYYASLTILLNIFLLKYGHLYNRFKFFRTGIYKIISCLLLFPQLLALVMGGGRGATVVFILGLFLIFIKDFIKNAHIFIRAVFIIMVVITIIPKLNYFGIDGAADVVGKNFGRIIAVGEAGVDVYDRTSGRNFVYQDAIKAIEDNPLGYGMFSYEKQLPDQPYPHNIVLEWTMQWGVFYALFQIVFLTLLFKHYRCCLLKDESLVILMPILVYQFTALLFSGSYMQEPFYWFSITFLLNYNSKNRLVEQIPHSYENNIISNNNVS